jgi:hypothetical protein
LIPFNSATFFIANSSSNELTTHIRLAGWLMSKCKPSTGNGERSNTAEMRRWLVCKRELHLFENMKDSSTMHPQESISILYTQNVYEI